MNKMNQYHNQNIKAWVSLKIKENKGDEILNLITDAIFDLHFGSDAITIERNYPGFVSATKRISEFFSEHIPQVIWYDKNCEHILYVRPEEFWIDENGEEYIENLEEIEEVNLWKLYLGELCKYINY